MKRLVFACLAVVAAAPAFAQSSTYVNPYVRNNGTYVQGHHRTTPDSSIYNNWSTRPNVNPYTGRVGTRDPATRPVRPYRGF
jgi:hypothetical protein